MSARRAKRHLTGSLRLGVGLLSASAALTALWLVLCERDGHLAHVSVELPTRTPSAAREGNPDEQLPEDGVGSESDRGRRSANMGEQAPLPKTLKRRDNPTNPTHRIERSLPHSVRLLADGRAGAQTSAARLCRGETDPAERAKLRRDCPSFGERGHHDGSPHPPGARRRGRAAKQPHYCPNRRPACTAVPPAPPSRLHRRPACTTVPPVLPVRSFLSGPSCPVLP